MKIYFIYTVYWLYTYYFKYHLKVVFFGKQNIHISTFLKIITFFKATFCIKMGYNPQESLENTS